MLIAIRLDVCAQKGAAHGTLVIYRPDMAFHCSRGGEQTGKSSRFAEIEEKFSMNLIAPLYGWC